ncbi:unnamed protein product [Prunus armeniaca]
MGCRLYSISITGVLNRSGGVADFNHTLIALIPKVMSLPHGKEVLIKAVCQAMPAYNMSVFRLPAGLCSKIESMFARYWWSKGSGKDIHWKTPKALSKHKTKGGWGLLEFPKSLIARMLKAQYFPKSDFLHAQGGSTPSFTWLSILWGYKLFSRGLQWRIGDGRLVNIYTDLWVPHHLTFTIQSSLSPCGFQSQCSYLIGPAPDSLSESLTNPASLLTST